MKCAIFLLSLVPFAVHAQTEIRFRKVYSDLISGVVIEIDGVPGERALVTALRLRSRTADSVLVATYFSRRELSRWLPKARTTLARTIAAQPGEVVGVESPHMAGATAEFWFVRSGSSPDTRLYFRRKRTGEVLEVPATDGVVKEIATALLKASTAYATP